ELFRSQLVARQQLVEVGAVASRQAGRLADVATGDLQDLRQVAARELIARLVEGGQAARGAAKRLLHEFDRDDGRLRQRHVLAHYVLQLTDVARPVGGRQQLHRLGGVDLADAAL